jgi:hypothetical protein
LKCSTSRRRVGRRGCEETSSTSESVAGGVFGEFGKRYARRLRCRASSIRREFSAHATADWQPPSVRSAGVSRQQSPVCRVVVGSPRRGVPRTCESAPAASGRPCRAVRKPRQRASRSRYGTAQPRTGDRRKSTPAAYVFAGRLRVEGGVRHSLSQWLYHRSAGIERVEKQTKRSLACVLIVRLHPVPSQPVTGGRNNGEGQHPAFRAVAQELGQCPEAGFGPWRMRR